MDGGFAAEEAAAAAGKQGSHAAMHGEVKAVAGGASTAVEGAVVRGRVVAVTGKGAVVALQGGLRGFCPLLHMADEEVTEAPAGMKVRGG